MQTEDLAVGGTTGTSSVASEGKTKYMGTKAIGGQVDDGKSWWKFSPDYFCFVNQRGSKVVIENEKGGGIEGVRREQKEKYSMEVQYLKSLSSMKGPPELSGHDFKVRPDGCWLVVHLQPR